MTHLLDTCICIFLIRTKASSVKARFDAFQIGDLAVSAITAAELRFGADKSADPPFSPSTTLRPATAGRSGPSWSVRAPRSDRSIPSSPRTAAPSD
jgi:hypothetical protein